MSASDVHIRRVIVNPPGFDVFGEAVGLHNHGDEDVDLTGWQLTDTLVHPGPPFKFTFPQFKLLAGGTVTVHTGDGTDDEQNLFWGRVDAVWNNKGDRAVLLDAQNSQIDTLAWTSAPPHGRVIDLDEILSELAGAGPIAGVAQPTSEVQWTLGPNGGEIFWQEYGTTGAAFHAGFPDSLPAGAPQPEATVIKVQESIYQKYVDLGGPEAMGRPLTKRKELTLVGDRQVLHQDFEQGSIYRSPETGPHMIKGAIRAKWLSSGVGGPSGQMGLPITDERPDSGSSGILFNDFEHGSIWFTPDGIAHQIFGIIVEFIGFHAFGITSGPGSDEIYFAVQAAKLNPPLDMPTQIDDGIWATVLPPSGPAYEEVDEKETRADTNIVYVGRAAPLVVKVHLWEQDLGDANALRDEIKTGVAAVGAVVAAFVPAASAVSLNPAVQSTVADILNAAAGTGDDFIGRGEFQLVSRQAILSILNEPLRNEFGLMIHRPVFMTDGDASYNAYFAVRPWLPD